MDLTAPFVPFAVPLSAESESSVCLSSIVFSSVLGVVALLFLMSSVTTSLLCLRMRTMKKTENDGYDVRAEVAAAAAASSSSRVSVSGTTLRPTRKSEYVHSTQHRIP